MRICKAAEAIVAHTDPLFTVIHKLRKGKYDVCVFRVERKMYGGGEIKNKDI